MKSQLLSCCLTYDLRKVRGSLICCNKLKRMFCSAPEKICAIHSKQNLTIKRGNFIEYEKHPIKSWVPGSTIGIQDGVRERSFR